MARPLARGAHAGLPEWIRPQLTELVDVAPDGPEWLHEIKFDGYRMHARLEVPPPRTIIDIIGMPLTPLSFAGVARRKLPTGVLSMNNWLTTTNHNSPRIPR